MDYCKVSVLEVSHINNLNEILYIVASQGLEGNAVCKGAAAQAQGADIRYLESL